MLSGRNADELAMNNTPTPPASLSGPGFVTLILDIPFGLGLPNGGFATFDPLKDMALIQPVLKEGSRSFFRNTPISGPTSFADLMSKARTFERPREDYSYLLTSELADGTQKATLNIHCGK